MARDHEDHRLHDQGPTAETDRTAVNVAAHKLLSRERSVTKAVFDQYTPPLLRASLILESDTLVGKSDSFPTFAVDSRSWTAGRSICCVPLLSERSLLLRSWLALMFFVDATYTAFLLPIMISFNLFGKYGKFLDDAVGGLLVIDMLFKFGSTVTLTNGFQSSTLTDGAMVARFYIRHGTFWLDALSILPTALTPLAYSLSDKNFENFIRALRLVRLARVVKLVKVMFSTNSIGSSRSVAQLALVLILDIAFAILVLVNLLACLWYTAGTKFTEGDAAVQGWMSQTYKFQGPTDYDACEAFVERQLSEGVPQQDLANVCDSLWFASTMLQRYLFAVYFVFTTISTTGYGDITPASTAETGVAVIIMLVGLVAFGVLIGSVADLFLTAFANSHRNKAVREKLTAAQAWMDRCEMPRELKKRVTRFYTRGWVDKADTTENDILAELPQSLKAQAIWFQLKPHVALMPAWAHLGDPFFLALCGRMRPLCLSPEQDVVQQGDPADRLFFLVEGTVQVLSSKSLAAVEYVKSPSSFGEVALLADDSPDCAYYLNTYQTFTPCRLWVLDVADVRSLQLSLLDLRPHLMEAMGRMVLQRLEGLCPRQKVVFARYLALTKRDDTPLADISAAQDALMAALDASLLQCYYALDIPDALSRTPPALSSTLPLPERSPKGAEAGGVPRANSATFDGAAARSRALADGEAAAVGVLGVQSAKGGGGSGRRMRPTPNRPLFVSALTDGGAGGSTSLSELPDARSSGASAPPPGRPPRSPGSSATIPARSGDDGAGRGRLAGAKRAARCATAGVWRHRGSLSFSEARSSAARRLRALRRAPGSAPETDREPLAAGGASSTMSLSRTSVSPSAADESSRLDSFVGSEIPPPEPPPQQGSSQDGSAAAPPPPEPIPGVPIVLKTDLGPIPRFDGAASRPPTMLVDAPPPFAPTSVPASPAVRRAGVLPAESSLSSRELALPHFPVQFGGHRIEQPARLAHPPAAPPRDPRVWQAGALAAAQMPGAWPLQPAPPVSGSSPLSLFDIEPLEQDEASFELEPMTNPTLSLSVGSRCSGGTQYQTASDAPLSSSAASTALLGDARVFADSSTPRISLNWISPTHSVASGVTPAAAAPKNRAALALQPVAGAPPAAADPLSDLAVRQSTESTDTPVPSPPSADLPPLQPGGGVSQLRIATRTHSEELLPGASVVGAGASAAGSASAPSWELQGAPPRPPRLPGRGPLDRPAENIASIPFLRSSGGLAHLTTNFDDPQVSGDPLDDSRAHLTPRLMSNDRRVAARWSNGSRDRAESAFTDASSPLSSMSRSHSFRVAFHAAPAQAPPASRAASASASAAALDNALPLNASFGSPLTTPRPDS